MLELIYEYFVFVIINIVYAAITVGHAFFFHFIEISKAVTL